ncbi:MAG TPA: SpoIIE family protein phosphatase [Actinoplanes sp.]
MSDPSRIEVLLRTELSAVADPAFDRFAAMVRTVLDVPVALVSLVGSDRQFFPGACGLADPWDSERQTPLSHSFCQHVVASAEPLIVVDARTDPRVLGNLAIDDLGVIGYAGMPLTDAHGHVLGSLCAIDEEPHQWTAAELTLLADLAATCSESLRLRIATYHAEREEDRARARQHLAEAAFDRSQLLLRASTTLAATSSLEEIVDRVRDLVTGTLDPAYVGVSVLDGAEYVSLASRGLLPAAVADRWARYRTGRSTPSALAARNGRLVLLPDLPAVQAHTPDALATFHEMGWQSAASMPLGADSGPVGALTFVWKEPYAVGDGEQTILAALAGYVTQALSRVALLDDRRTAAATMQKALLSPLPTHERLTMAASYVPAHHEDHVGGDWYDAMTLDGGRLALVIGDVAGHSISAAAAMSQYRSMLRTLLIDRHEPPSALLRRLEHTSRTLGHLVLTTLVVAYLDPAPLGGHTLTWANAGHPPPSLVLPDGQVTVLHGRDPLLGAGPRIPRRNHACHVPPGSTLLLHTDGLIETRAATIDDGMARLHDLLRRHAGTEPGRLADLLIEHTGTVGWEDDVALLIVATPLE